VQQKVEMGTRQDRPVSWLYLHAIVDPDSNHVKVVIQNSTEDREEDEWGLESV